MRQDSTSLKVNSYPSARKKMNTRVGDSVTRLFEILVSLVGMALLAPLFYYLVWRIKRDSPGPVFYHGLRVGRGGATFRIRKFRTMYERPESYQGPSVTALDDERITPLGRWLRDTKLNELPQLWNVFKGDMSLVGPRPEDPQIVATWPEEIRREILTVRPGITSPASVLYRDEETLLNGIKVMETYLADILPSKLRLDQLYVRHRSFWNDLDIIFWTLLVLLPRANKYTPPEEHLFLGPINRIMRRYVNWFSADVLITLGAVGAAGLIWRSFGPLNLGWPTAISLAIGFALLFSLTNAILGVNRVEWAKATATDALDLLPGVVLATALTLLFNYFYPHNLVAILYGGELPIWVARPLLPTGLLLMASSIAFLGFVAARYRSRLITGLATRWVARRGAGAAAQERVLIIGGGETGQFTAWMLHNGKYSETLQVIGFVDDDLYKQGVRIHGVNVLGQRAHIPRLVAEYDIGIIVFAIHNISIRERQQVLDICSNTPARLVLFPDIPAALSDIARNGVPHPAQNTRGEKDPNANDVQLPCHLCLTKVSPLKVDGWLAQLEETALSGDLQDLQAQIRAMRAQIHGDAAVQLAANLLREEE